MFELFLINEVALYKQPEQSITMTPQEYHSFMDRDPLMWIAEWDTEQSIKERRKTLHSLQKIQNKRDFIEASLEKYDVSLHLWYSK